MKSTQISSLFVVHSRQKFQDDDLEINKCEDGSATTLIPNIPSTHARILSITYEY